MQYGYRIAKEIMDRYQSALDKSLRLQSLRDSYQKTNPKYWTIVDRLDAAQRKCRSIDKELQEHLQIIKPNIHEQVRIY